MTAHGTRVDGRLSAANAARDQGPRDAPARVVGLYTAPRAGAPMEARAQIEVVRGRGIGGDRYAARLGHWSDPRWPDQELTLVEAEVADALGYDAGTLRRNVATCGVRLDDLIARTFQIGNVVLVGVRRCDPCRYLDSLTRPGMARALAGRGGLRTRILDGGTIRVGDRITTISAPAAPESADRISSSPATP
jgi:MOSC domain-containing protein YiiM